MRLVGDRGSAVYDSKQKAWHVRYYLPEEVETPAVQTGLAAEGREYPPGQETVPWREETVPVSDFAPVRYYDLCYEYFAENKAPFVPMADSRELIRVLEECRRDAGL